MRIVLYIIAITCLISMAAMSYSQNYATRETLAQISTVRASISSKQAQLRALQDEWAYLNRPQRIKDLTLLNFDYIQYDKSKPRPDGDFNDLPFLPDPTLYDPSQEVLD